jgi:hypothetical protein
MAGRKSKPYKMNLHKNFPIAQNCRIDVNKSTDYKYSICKVAIVMVRWVGFGCGWVKSMGTKRLAFYFFYVTLAVVVFSGV